MDLLLAALTVCATEKFRALCSKPTCIFCDRFVPPDNCVIEHKHRDRNGRAVIRGLAHWKCNLAEGLLLEEFDGNQLELAKCFPQFVYKKEVFTMLDGVKKKEDKRGFELKGLQAGTTHFCHTGGMGNITLTPEGEKVCDECGVSLGYEFVPK